MLEQAINIIICCLFTYSLGNLRLKLGFPEVLILNIALFKLLSSDANQYLLLYTFFAFRNYKENYTLEKNQTKFENKKLLGFNERVISKKNEEKTNQDTEFLKNELIVEKTEDKFKPRRDVVIFYENLQKSTKILIYKMKFKKIFNLKSINCISSNLIDEILPIITELFSLIVKIAKRMTLGDFTCALILFLMFLAAQVLALSLKNKNLARKNFHFLFFFICLKYSRLYIDCLQILIYIAALLCITRFITTFLSCFLNKNPEKDSFSFLIFLGSITYPYFFLNREQYFKVVISICILDSFAAITGIYFKSTERSFSGFMGGQIASYITELMILKKIDIFYHTTMGIVELYCPWNDNSTLSIASVIFQYLRKNWK